MPTHLSNTVTLLLAAVTAAYLTSLIGFWPAMLLWFLGYLVLMGLHRLINPLDHAAPGFGWAVFRALNAVQFAGLSTIPATTMFIAQQSRPIEAVSMYLVSAVLIIVLIICGRTMSRTLIDRAPISFARK